MWTFLFGGKKFISLLKLTRTIYLIYYLWFLHSSIALVSLCLTFSHGDEPRPQVAGVEERPRSEARGGQEKG